MSLLAFTRVHRNFRNQYESIFNELNHTRSEFERYKRQYEDLEKHHEEMYVQMNEMALQLFELRALKRENAELKLYIERLRNRLQDPLMNEMLGD